MMSLPVPPVIDSVPDPSVPFSLALVAVGGIVLANLVASYWLIGALVTITWAFSNRGSPGTRWSAIAGVVGVAAAVVVLARGLLSGVISLDGVLAILGVTSLATGTMRLAWMLHDKQDARHPVVHRTALGLIEITLGVVLILVHDLGQTLATAAGVWGLVAGTIMLIDAITMRRSESLPDGEDEAHR